MLNGSVRYQLTPAERSVWVDLLALAALGPAPGLIADNDSRPFPLAFLANRLNIKVALLQNTIKKCAEEGRIIHSDGLIRISNWDAYQSEYERQKPYRISDKLQNNPVNVDTKVTTIPVTLVRSRVEESRAEEKRAEEKRADAPPSPPQPPQPTAAATISFENLLSNNGLHEELVEKFPSLDLNDELLKCQLWWTASKRKLKAPELAFRNWLQKAQSINEKDGKSGKVVVPLGPWATPEG